MYLTVDIGNTVAKVVLFDGGRIAERFGPSEPDAAFADRILERCPAMAGVACCSVRASETALEAALRERIPEFTRVTGATPTPLKNLYATPETLGPDRLAAAVGAAGLYPGRNLLVVDLGTAITFDVVTAAGEFLGGNISPGAEMRFRAMHEQTGRLPQGRLDGDAPLTGRSTAEAVNGGVVRGIVHETEGYIRALEEKFGNITVIFTGGDAHFFVKLLKKAIFANYDLVALGLNRILEYNA